MENGGVKKYTCPMHPEIIQEKPGRCIKCGMDLVEIDAKNKIITSQANNKELGILSWQSYMPLAIVILMITLVAGIISLREQFSIYNFILYFMAGFFVVFAGFKLMDLKGFAQGYFTYDLLSQKWFGYGYIYPFIELAFGLLMIARYHPNWLLWAEFLVMAFSGLGVSIKVAKKEKIKCVCLGTFLKVPLTYVTLVEDFGMAFLAMALLFY